MYVPPNSEIMLCWNVPLDPSYEHTLYFVSDAAAYSELSTNYRAAKFNSQSYSRVGRNAVRIRGNAEEFNDVNYLVFNNERAFWNKHWYCFVTGVNYINENTTEITFEVDVMMTFQHNYTLMPSFVEREHSVGDEFGANTVPENVEVGEYIYDRVNRWGTEGGTIVVATTMDWDPSTATITPAYPSYYQGIFGGTKMLRFDDPEEFQDYIAALDSDNKRDAIVAVYYLPAEIAPVEAQAEGGELEPEIEYEDTPYSTTITLQGYASLRYQPRNKKLYQYPFNFLYVEDGNGNEKEYRYEGFVNPAEPSFNIYGVSGPPPEVSLFPIGYYTPYANPSPPPYYLENRNFGLRMINFPQASWSSDAYQAWLAQNRFRNDLQMDAAQLGMNMSLGKLLMSNGTNQTGLAPLGVSPSPIRGLSAIAGLSASALSAAMAMGERAVASKLPRVVRGQASIGQLDMATRKFGYDFWNVHLIPEYMLRLDEYFDKYGYATNRVKVPETHARPHWTYTKTSGCIITHAHMPAEAVAAVCKIFDKGITFWMNASEVGNYALDNSPVTPSNEGGEENNGTTSEA